MALEVIGPGLGRTGTNSMKLALEQLGFGPCHHMHEVLNNRSCYLIGSQWQMEKLWTGTRRSRAIVHRLTGQVREYGGS